MAPNIIIERLILEIDFDSEREYHEFAAYVQTRLLPEIQEELERVLSTFSQNQEGNLVIDTLEIDLPPLPYTVLKSAELKNQIGAGLAIQLADVSNPHGEKLTQTEERHRQGQHIHSPSLDSENQWTKRGRGRAQSATSEADSPRTHLRHITERQSIHHYLLTGRFYPGMEHTIQHIGGFLENEKEQISFIRWVQSLRDTDQQYLALKRLALQLPASIVEAVWRHPDVQMLLASFPQSIQVPGAIAEVGVKKAPSSVSPSKSLTQEEGLYVENAGVVIVAPYLPALFHKSGLLKDTQKAFKDEQSVFYAIHLLQYLAKKSRIETEDSTPLFKLLCGLQLNAPISIPMEVTDEHKQLADRLLLQVLKNWDIKLGDKIDYLRGSFFIRSGKLSKLDLHWLLTVETKMYDEHLFKKLPWSFKRILLPWMPQMLQVDWY
jgi:hypothetical protein